MRDRNRSVELFERARHCIPGGVHSNVRLDAPPMYFTRGEGAWLWDVDGNDYVDYLLGQGPAFLGHAPPVVTAAVEQACRSGMVFGAQHPLEIEASELICGLVGWAEMVRFGTSGTEVVQAALRAARAATGRTLFIRFEGHYHGWLDNVLVSVAKNGARPASAGQPPEVLRESITVPWNDIGALEEVFDHRAGDIAAVLMEPMMINAGAIEPRPGYLEGVRKLCDDHGAVLIFDEVITGFRLGLGGATGRFGVTPDLATYGKALAGSWPVGALAGRRELMEPFGSGTVNHSGTFNANVMAMAAVTATLKQLRDEPPYEQIERIGGRLMKELGELGLRIQGTPMAFHATFADDDIEVTDYRSLQQCDTDRYRRLARRLVDEGVWVATRGVWYVSAAHGDKEVEITVERASRAMERL
jgi:glutamate-1-semialdehyde 2,1-aminomutase